MRTIRSVSAVLMSMLWVGCGGSSGNGATGGSGITGTGGGNGGSGIMGSGGSGAGGTAGSSAVTFWKDVAPLYNTKCVGCHQEGGIAPFALDNYADAAANAALELARTASGAMPPYFMVHDDSCGSFDEAGRTLTAAEKATIAAWVNGGRAEGTPVTLTRPPKPVLSGALDVATPMFSPVPQGGDLALNDEYRCFALDPPNAKAAFVTGYDVTPGEPSIIHHVLVFVVDPQAMGTNGETNGATIAALDNDSPDRLGWPCFGGAGDGLDVESVPVTWAPGQGIVNYPAGMGVSLSPTAKLVVQVHYNLADPASVGKTDRTTVHLKMADTVDRQLVFVLPDPFLESLGNPTPDTLTPGLADSKYTWTRTAKQMGLGAIRSADLVAVFPHMHGRGLRQTMTLDGACASHLEGWDFHWQEFYFYKTPLAVTASSQFQVTCEYDTSADTEPVMPGWGTRNEMCLNILMLALPAQ
jgi:copper type II ascorbate-dependent monooxygenase-like protein